MPQYEAYRVLVPQSGIETTPSAVKVLSPNYWAVGEFPNDT